jgi:hypothetical protein
MVHPIYGRRASVSIRVFHEPRYLHLLHTEYKQTTNSTFRFFSLGRNVRSFLCFCFDGEMGGAPAPLR